MRVAGGFNPRYELTGEGVMPSPVIFCAGRVSFDCATAVLVQGV